ncbi:hypothetical protein L2E82_05656 [Cichorium intybus]|uniref:Uncharacterized protein n=1 Tax=Cichorium intybus TaxID=13427 RepID=A0ACB9H8Z6_CICIN|nr:hypothetical protein L2E82_05656 [Cichorium intybus]
MRGGGGRGGGGCWTEETNFELQYNELSHVHVLTALKRLRNTPNMITPDLSKSQFVAPMRSWMQNLSKLKTLRSSGEGIPLFDLSSCRWLSGAMVVMMLTEDGAFVDRRWWLHRANTQNPNLMKMRGEDEEADAYELAGVQ